MLHPTLRVGWSQEPAHRGQYCSLCPPVIPDLPRILFSGTPLSGIQTGTDTAVGQFWAMSGFPLKTCLHAEVRRFGTQACGNDKGEVTGARLTCHSRLAPNSLFGDASIGNPGRALSGNWHLLRQRLDSHLERVGMTSWRCEARGLFVIPERFNRESRKGIKAGLCARQLLEGLNS